MISSLLSAALVINEIMASNAGMVLSPAINFDSWIELYNPTTENVDLGGLMLSDDRGHQWQMPQDMGSVPAGGFKVVWLGSDDIKGNQAPFKLDCDGGTIILSDKQGAIIASVTYPEALSRTAWARLSDGGDEWGWTSTPTPAATNASALFATQRLDAPVVSVGSRLFNGSLSFEVAIPEGATLMYTTDGSLPQPPQQEGEEVSPWTEFIINGDCEGTDATCLISRDADGNGDVERIEEGIGYNQSRGIRVHAISNPAHDYDAQLFVYTPGHIWRSGEKYHFKMKIRADKPSHISAQTHTTPHNYIYWSVLAGGYDVSTEWQEIDFEGTITDEQVGMEYNWWTGEQTAKDMQTIAFNLNGDQQENNFYFDDVSWQLFTGDGSDIATSKQSPDGKFTVSSTMAYTFRLFQEGYLPSVPVTRSFIQTSNKYTFPVVSIVGDRRYFTDPKIGLDCDGDGTNGRTGNGQDRPRNYNQPWDRPVNFSYIGTDGEMVFNQDVNISVSGGWTRAQSERSFKLKSNKVFDGQNHMNFSFFPQKPYIRSKALLLRNGGNDVWVHNSRFMDPALQAIVQRSGIDVDVQSYVPIIEYVNGKCRGVINLREPNNDKFVYANFGYDDDEIDMFENFEFKQGTSTVLQRIFELGTHINEAGAYDELKTLLDVDEFTNWMAVELYLGNEDWPDNNIKAYRSQHDGRYRFVLFDLDYSFGLRYGTSNENPFNFFAGFSQMPFVTFFLNLLDNDDFRRRFIDTYCIVAGSVFEKDRATAIVDELAARLRPMLTMTGDSHSPDRCVSTIKSKLQNRISHMTTCMQQFSQMKLSGAKKQTVTLKTDTEGARLTVNGVNVPYAEFKGTLFAPIRLEAEAPAGFRFTGWRKGNSIVSTEAVYDLPSDNITSLTATFTPLTADERQQQGITPVRINEVSAANGIHVNEYFKRNDWVELFNTTDEPIDVEGMYLSDNPLKPTKYQISKEQGQASTLIPAHGHLIVWCDKLEPLSQLHASFKLAAEGGDVLLTAADETWTDRLTYTALNSDQTAGRYPDGAADVILMNVPTIASANLTSTYAIPMEQPSVSSVRDQFAASALTVRYTVGRLAIHGPADQPVSVVITSLSGQQTASFSPVLHAGYAHLSLAHLPSGVYIASVTDAEGHTVNTKFIVK